MHPVIRSCREEDLPALCEISYETYNDTFGQLNTPANLKAYLEQAFDPEKLRNELRNPHSAFYFLSSGETPAGYLKVNEYKAQTDLFDPQSLEVERIYVKKQFHGQGMGHLLLQWAIQEAIRGQKGYLWLGVWEKNTRALQFYQKHGFYPTTTHSFWMGDEEQTDYIMRKDLP